MIRVKAADQGIGVTQVCGFCPYRQQSGAVKQQQSPTVSVRLLSEVPPG